MWAFIDTHLASIDQVTSYDMPADHFTPVGVFGSVLEPASPSLAWDVLTSVVQHSIGGLG